MVTAADLIAAVRKASLVASDIAGIKVHLRGLIGAERRILIERAKAGDPMTAPEIVAIGVCHPDGSPMFAADEAEQLDGAELDRVAREVLRVSKLLPGEGDGAKNSEATPNA